MDSNTQTGLIHALSMTLTAVISNLPPQLCRQIHRDLDAALQVEVEAEEGDPPPHAVDRNSTLQAFLDLLAASASRA